MGRINPSTVKAVKAVSYDNEQTLEEWFKEIETAIEEKQDPVIHWTAKRQQVIKKLLDAKQRGISARQLSKIIGIPHQTISEWLKEAKP